MNSEQRRIVFLYADTGGGHRSTAQAAQKAVHQLYGDAFTTKLVNANHYLPYPFNQMEKAYPVFVNSLSGAYHLFWHATNTELYVDLSRRYIELTSKIQGEALLREHPADLYVSCQPVLNQLIPGIVKQGDNPAKVISIVSDLVTVHAGFWSPKIDHFVVPTEEARQRALENHVDADKISITGQPVVPDFAARVQQGRLMREQLGLDATRPAVLLMGGGDGMGHLVQTATAIAQSNLPLQLIVVCGRNEAARNALSAVETTLPTMPMKVLGFCDNVPEWMGAADVLVTKAGPGTICEGFIAELPIILYDAVPGQESGNIDLVVKNGAGAWCPSPKLAVQQLQHWLLRPNDMAHASQVSASLAKPDSALEIAKVIAQFAERSERVPCAI